jgi:transposase InsO family protein
MRGVAHSPGVRVLLMQLHEQGRSLSALSRETGIARRVLSRWWTRYQQDGGAGLEPRSRRPRRSPRRLVPGLERKILRVRRAGLGPARIALVVGASPATVYRVLARHGRNRSTEPVRRPVLRYEKSRPGELLHLDLKYLRGLDSPRQEYQFAAVDDFSREAVASIHDQRSSRTATAFLEDTLARLPYPVEAVLTDNDLVFTMRFAYYSHRQTYFEQVCKSLGIEHRLLRPHRPESNGKVERFLKTVDDECYAVRRPRSSRTRMRVLEEFLWFYNHQRPHLSLKGLTPVQRRENYFLQAGVRLMS